MLGKLSVPGRPTNLEYSRARAYKACSRWDGVCLDISILSIFSLLFLPLWESARYRLKHCLEGLLNNKQPPKQLP